LSEIARRIGKNKSTVSRELKRNSSVVTMEDRLYWRKVQNMMSDEELDAYVKSLSPKKLQDTQHWSVLSAQARYQHRQWVANQKRRRKRPETRKWVIEKIKQDWSPDQIAGRSKFEAPEPVSHEYVYQVVYRDKKQGGSLFRLLKRFGRRKQRFARREYPGIPGRIGIEQRPNIVQERKRLGDLEADLIVGHRSSGYILSVVDRKSKFTVLRKLKTKRKTGVRRQLDYAIKKLGQVHTLTLDNGREFADHAQLPVAVYFAHPYCSTERGTIENTNALVRHYLRKKTSFKHVSQRKLNKIQARLNNRPRKCLRYLTPKEVHFKTPANPHT
jgi:IS30 family transposase